MRRAARRRAAASARSDAAPQPQPRPPRAPTPRRVSAQVLQVPFDATQSEIKKAYRLQSKQSHPDKSNDSGTAFLTLRRAYDVVGNKKLRRKYDQRARSAARAAAAPAFDVLRADTAAPPAGKRHNKRLASDRPLKLGDALVSPDGSHEALFDFDGNFRIVESGSRSVEA